MWKSFYPIQVKCGISVFKAKSNLAFWGLFHDNISETSLRSCQTCTTKFSYRYRSRLKVLNDFCKSSIIGV